MSKRYQGGVLGVGFNPIKAPNAPTVGTATAGGNNCASVTFTAPACVGGSAITRYTVQSNPGGFSGAAAGSPITVSGLTNGQSYTFGVFALNSYGPSPISAFSNSITAALDGTLGIFALGLSLSNTRITTRDKYTFSNCAVSAATAASVASANSSAAGNTAIGIFALGFTNSGAVTTRDKYTYSGCVVSAGGAATAASYSGSATGNSTTGIFALGRCNCGGTALTTRNKYTYSGCVVAAGGAATQASYSGSAAGNSTVGIFALGFTTTFSSVRNKYTYSGDVVSSATSATSNSVLNSAAGNSTVGIFSINATGFTPCFCYVTTTARNKYTYSNDTVTAGGAATVATYSGSATGNSTRGIFALGACGSSNTNLNTRNKYTYSGDAVSAATAASGASGSGSAASNGIAGVTS